MKRLTINQIAGAGLKHGKRAYLSLAVGIFLSIFLITVLCLCVQGVYLAQREKIAQRVGYEDGFLLDSPYSDAEMMADGMFDEIGHVYVTAGIEDADYYLGYYDETGAQMLNRRMIEGRMPGMANEIALEKSVLEAMRLGKGVGDQIELSVVPVDGIKEKRVYNIVGILTEQTSYLAVGGEYMNRLLKFPAILVHEDEKFETGRIAVHQLVSIREGILKSSVQNKWWARYDEPYYNIHLDGRVERWPEDILVKVSAIFPILMVVALLGGALIIATCVGIAQAMEGQLSRRIEQIGMLRAVGATRRQIRRIFGREAWMLAGVLTPVSTAAGCGAVWGLSKMLPENIIFRATPALLIPILVISAVCILLSARLPLIRASKTMPMSVIRDTELLRKSKSIKGKKSFSAPRLISARQLRLHPTRQIGAAVLVMMMLFSVGGAIVVANAAQDTFRIYEEKEAFSLDGKYSPNIYRFVDVLPEYTLTESDINQLRSIPQVKQVKSIRELKVNILIDEVTDYLEKSAKYEWFGTNDHLIEEGHTDERHDKLRSELGIENILLDLDMAVCDFDLNEALGNAVVDGKIDMQAINEGRQVIMFAPESYIEVALDGTGWRGDSLREGVEYVEDKNHVLIVNDFFKAGQTFDLVQLYQVGDPGEDAASYQEELNNLYNHPERRDAQITIGAVVNGSGSIYMYHPGIITTLQGAKALGLNTETFRKAQIYLSDTVDVETEEQMESRISGIAMRGQGINVYNLLESARESRQNNRNLILSLACVALVFFMVSVSIISGNVQRRIRSDKRMIGTLRAVGADKRALVGCYTGHVLLSIMMGLVGALAIMIWVRQIQFETPDISIPIICMLFFAALLFFCCQTGLRKALREVMAKSIVENIREL